MAVTKHPGGAILMAALALPGLAQAENAPDTASLSLRYLDYKDSQPNLERIHVRSPSAELILPIAGAWSLRAALVSDVISGASPRYHTAVSGASHFEEKRKGVDASLTRYFSRASATVSAGRSGEHDYVSRFVSAQATMSSEDNNTTWLAGLGVANDRINPVNKAVENAHKRVLDVMLGVTRVLTPADIGQLLVTHVRGRGYYSNPYKYVDQRPTEHDSNTLTVRWNHHFAAAGGTSRLSYRYYADDYDVKAHTLSGEYVLPLAGGWALTPSARVYSQSAASFYFNPGYHPVFGPPFPPGYNFADKKDISADQRLSAYGALTLGMRIAKEIGRNTTVDVKWEEYRQRGSWRLFGSGSPGLQTFSARSIQAGVTTRW